MYPKAGVAEVKYYRSMDKKELGIIAAGILGSSAVMLGESVVNLALPHIGSAFNVPFSALQWVVDGYNLTLASLILLGGSLGDRFGLRRMFAISCLAFFVLSALCAVAWSAWALIVLRALLGVAGALLTPVSLALLNARLPQELRGRAIGYWTAATSIVLALGPLVGGYFVDVFSWRAIFAANVPLALAALWLGLASLSKDEPKEASPTDWLGVVLGFIGLGGITFGLIEGPAQGWTPLTLCAIAIGVAALVALAFWERHAKHPLIELALFKNSNFSATNAATLFLYAGFAGFGFVLTVFLQTIGGYSAMAAGAAFLPASIILALLSGRVGALSTKWGPRLFMTAGPLLCAAGMLLMWNLVPHVPYISGVLPGVIVFSLGLALVVAPLTATALDSAPEEKSGIASAINNGTATAGPLIAVALLGLWGPQHIYHYSLALCAGMAILAGAISFAFVRKS